MTNIEQLKADIEEIKNKLDNIQDSFEMIFKRYG